MKATLFLMAAVSACGICQNANAIELTFKFNVNSSGPALYVCNAGVRHAVPTNQVCYLEGTQTACNPETCATNDSACVSNCKCTGNLGGAYRMDFLNAGTGAWNSTTTASTSMEAGTSQYNSLFTDVVAWDKRIDNLSINLGSERYGAQYFVDVCFRGSQIEFFDNGIASTNHMFVQTSVSDFSSDPTISYKSLSGLAVHAEYVCDLQGVGTYKHARDNSNNYDTSANEAIFGAGDMHGSSNPVLIGGSATTLLDNWINTDTKAPRFCKVRYYFDETAVNNIRTWQLHGAKVCTFTQIEEPSTN